MEHGDKTKTPYYLLRFTDLGGHTTEWKEETFSAICDPLTKQTMLMNQDRAMGMLELYKIFNENELEDERNTRIFMRGWKRN